MTDVAALIDPRPDPRSEHRSEQGPDPIRSAEGFGVDAVMDIPVTVQVVIGSATIPIAELMRTQRGAVIQLDHRVGEPVDVVVNGRVVARGELVVLDDDPTRFGVSLTEIVASPSASSAAASLHRLAG